MYNRRNSISVGEGAVGRLDLKRLFGNDRPVEVDLGCGKGLFLVKEALARREVNFLGVDRLTRKLTQSMRRIREMGLDNIRLLRCDATYLCRNMLHENSIDAYHIYFPDPWPKKRHAKHRFMTKDLLDAMAVTLREGGRVLIITDNLVYYRFIIDLFDEQPLFTKTRFRGDEKLTLTDFEMEFLEKGLPIFRAGFMKALSPSGESARDSRGQLGE